MTKHLSDTLGLPSLEDALREQGALPPAREPEYEDDDEQAAEDISARAAKRLAEVGGEDHANAMDKLHGEVMQHARDLMDLGFNMEHARARGIFEQAANFYKIGLDAKNSKRDAQLKAMRLVLDQRRVEIEERRAASETGEPVGGATVTGVLLTSDRNELLKALKAKAETTRS